MKYWEVSTLNVLLVTMPWSSLHRPALALGTLVAAAQKCRFSHRIEQLYGNVRWAEWLLRETTGALTPTEYAEIADGYFVGTGEWIFANSLYGCSEWRVDKFCEYASNQGLDVDTLLAMHRLSPRFIEELAAEIAARGCDVVGFSSTFLQNVPSLALAQALKLRTPKVTILFGGGNCDGIQGVALHRNFPFVDMVLRGEGELSFVSLLDHLEVGAPLADIPGLCWRTDGGPPNANVAAPLPVAIAQIPPPDHAAYFAAIEDTTVERWIEPELVLEASRGCWWGRKHQCTFCGLNGTFIDYRSKAADDFWQELSTAVTRYGILDILLADNILDMRYFKTLLPRIAESDWDLRIFCEVKSNLTAEQVAQLKRAHVVNLQPGIESLSSRVLELMDKGVTGIQNIRLLRDCQSAGVTVDWNYLFGFPGETAADYTQIIRQVPALSHLQPPAAAYRVALERFSPYFDHPELGLQNAGPAQVYSLVYDLPQEELQDLVYLFDSVPAGIGGQTETDLVAAVATWRHSHTGSNLTYRQSGGEVCVFDYRKNWPERTHVLRSGGPAEAYLALLEGHSMRTLLRALKDRNSLVVEESQLQSWLDLWLRDGLVFYESDRYVALVTTTESIHATEFVGR